MNKLDKLLITENQNIIENFVEGESVQEKVLQPYEAICKLNYRIILNNAFTLRDYFELIKKYDTFKILDPYFNEYLEIFEICQKNNCKCNDIEHLTLEKMIDCKFHKNINDVNIDIVFNGIKKKQIIELDTYFLDQILDHKIKLGQTHINIEEKNGNSIIQKHGNGSFTLYEFIKNIIWELSFFIDPKNRNKEK